MVLVRTLPRRYILDPRPGPRTRAIDMGITWIAPALRMAAHPDFQGVLRIDPNLAALCPP